MNKFIEWFDEQDPEDVALAFLIIFWVLIVAGIVVCTIAIGWVFLAFIIGVPIVLVASIFVAIKIAKAIHARK